MRCTCCNKNLSDYETTLKHAVTGAYLDTCLNCLSEIAYQTPMPVKGRHDLIQSINNISDDDNDSVDSELMNIEYHSNFKGYSEDY